MINIEKNGVIDEKDVLKSLAILFEFSNKLSKINWSNTRRFIYIILAFTFFAIIMSIDQKTFLNPFWVSIFIFSLVVFLQIYILQKRAKSQNELFEKQLEMCRNFNNKNYTFIITDNYIINQFGDIESKYPTNLIKICYTYKNNFILYYEKYFNQFLLFSFDAFNNEEFENFYNFLKEKKLLDTKYDVVVSKKEIDLTNELHEK